MDFSFQSAPVLADESELGLRISGRSACLQRRDQPGIGLIEHSLAASPANLLLAHGQHPACSGIGRLDPPSRVRQEYRILAVKEESSISLFRGAQTLLRLFAFRDIDIRHDKALVHSNADGLDGNQADANLAGLRSKLVLEGSKLAERGNPPERLLFLSWVDPDPNVVRCPANHFLATVAD